MKQVAIKLKRNVLRIGIQVVVINPNFQNIISVIKTIKETARAEKTAISLGVGFFIAILKGIIGKGNASKQKKQEKK